MECFPGPTLGKIEGGTERVAVRRVDSAFLFRPSPFQAAPLTAFSQYVRSGRSVCARVLIHSWPCFGAPVIDVVGGGPFRSPDRRHPSGEWLGSNGDHLLVDQA